MQFPYSDIIVADKCLRFSSDRRAWHDARNQCLMTNGDLEVIEDDADVLRKKLKSNQRYWIGLRKKSWRWILNYNGLFRNDI